MSQRENTFVMQVQASAQDLFEMQAAVGALNAEPLTNHPGGSLLFKAYEATPIDRNRQWFRVAIEFQIVATNADFSHSAGAAALPWIETLDRFQMIEELPRLAESAFQLTMS